MINNRFIIVIIGSVCRDWTLTCLLLDADSWSLQVGGLDEDGGGVQSFRRESIEAVLRQASRDGDLMLSFTGSCTGRHTQTQTLFQNKSWNPE